MKKYATLLTCSLLTVVLNAQNGKVMTAAMQLQEYIESQLKDTSALFDARAAIDLAAVNEKTKDEPKMWMNRGEVYMMLFQHKFNNIINKAMAPGSQVKDIHEAAKAQKAAYSVVDTNDLFKAANSFIKILQTVPPKDSYASEAKESRNIPTCRVYIENKAGVEFTNQHYEIALACYEKARLFYKILGITDSSYMINVYNTAQVAMKAKNYPKSIQYDNELISLKYGEGTPYMQLYDLYTSQKDNDKAIDILKKGRAAYPDDVNLLIAETNIYLHSHDDEKALNNLQLAINKIEAGSDKSNQTKLLANLYFVFANAYDRLANPKDSTGKFLPKPANYNEYYGKAESNYLKSLTLVGDNFDALFDIGALYNNRATEIEKDANNLPLSATEKFNKMKDEAKGYFLKAQPYLEKAHTLEPNDTSTTDALRQIYTTTGQNDKAANLK